MIKVQGHDFQILLNGFFGSNLFVQKAFIKVN